MEKMNEAETKEKQWKGTFSKMDVEKKKKS